MTQPIRIVGLSGSLRSGSFNAHLLRAAARVAPAGIEIEVETIRGVPLYDGDVEAAEGLPARVTELKDKIAAADALFLVTPEYNNSIPGVFKNAIDWLTRPASDIPKVFGGKPVAFIGASPGGFGTILAQNHWLPVLRTLKCQLWTAERLLVSRAGGLFDAEGNLTDDKTREALRTFVAGFAASIRD